MFIKAVILALFCTLVNSNPDVYTVYKHLMLGPDGQTCEDYLKNIEGTYFNQSIYTARLEERLDCKDTELSCKKQICDLKLNSNCNGSSAVIQNIKQKILNLETENNRVSELLSNYSKIAENMTGFIPLPSVGKYAFTDCGESVGPTIFDILDTTEKRYFTPNPHFFVSGHANNMNWTRARNYCNNCGLKLANFETQNEFDELDTYFRNTYRRYNLPSKYYTGAFRHTNETHIFTWLNGQIVNLSNDSYYEYNNQITDDINTIVLYSPYNPAWSGEISPNYNRSLYLMYGYTEYEYAAPLCETI